VSPSAGGGIDFIARVVAPFMSKALGEQVLIDNRGGAGGLIAVQTVLGSKPDGYTLLCYGPPAWINPLIRKNVSYDPLRDLVPIGLITRTANLLVVHPSLPVKSARDLIALAKKRPGDLLDAGSDTGSSAHLAAELFKSMADIKVRRVPYKGVGAGIAALVAGEVQIMIPAISAAMPHVKSGRLRALGVSTAEPTKLAPGMPTIASTGLPGYEVESQNAIFAPTGTPKEIIVKLNEVLNEVLKNPEVRDKLLSGGTEPVGGPPDLAARLIKAEMTKWAKVIKEAGIHAD
jgi:tripartite-type tricarboxylate transporter receptor subunit TctC